MNIHNRFFDVFVENNYFYIIENQKKPTKKTIIETLKKIESILKNNLEYHYEHENNAIEFYKNDSYEILKLISSKSYQIYKKQLNFKINKNSRIKLIYNKIKLYFKPSNLFPLPNELICEIVKKLTISDLSRLSLMNKNAHEHAQRILCNYSREFGYQKESLISPIIYLNRLLNEFIAFSKASQNEAIQKTIVYNDCKKSTFKNGSKNLLENVFEFDKNKILINSENTLKNLKNFNPEIAIKILSHSQIYSTHYEYLLNFFVKRTQSFNYTCFGKNYVMLEEISSTPFHQAVLYQKKNVIETMLLYFDPNNTNSLEETALHIVVNPEIAQILINSGADVNKQAKNGQTPLHFAAVEGRFSVLKILLDNGADANLVDNHARIALHCLALKKHRVNDLKILNLLLKYESSINCFDAFGMTPLHLAVFKGNLSIVKALLKNGADVNCLSNAGETPLLLLGSRFFKCKKILSKIIKLLIENGASIEVFNRYDQSPMHKAALTGDRKMISCLLRHNADINILDHQGNTPLDLALKKNSYKVVWFLENRNASRNTT